VTAADPPACGVRARLLATIPWNAPQGLPARVIANDRSTVSARRRYAPVRIRALPDGAVQLSASGKDRHVLVALEHGRVASHATLRAGPSRLLDALLMAASDALLLLDEGGRQTVRRVDAAGGIVWERPAHADRILAAPHGAGYLAEPGTTPRVAWLDEHGQPAGAPIELTEPAGEILADPLGRLVTFRHDPTRGLRLWTVVDPSTGERHGTYGTPQAWPSLGAPIGVTTTAPAASSTATATGPSSCSIGATTVCGSCHPPGSLRARSQPAMTSGCATATCSHRRAGP